VADTKKIKLISLVQPNFQTGPAHLNSFYLPYSVGCVWAHAATNQTINQEFKLDQIVWKRDPIDVVATKLATNNIVVFSTYVWNRQYNYTLAAKIKSINPDIITIFGGPEISVCDPNIFIKHPFMDYVVKKEGELIFLSLLLHIVNSNEPIPSGVLINKNSQLIDTGEGERIFDLSILASPYLTGVFDQLVSENTNVAWAATLETNRGCPYQCTFCDWGSLTYNKVRQFPIEKVYAELEWIGKYCDGVYNADANFGMFIDRDQLIVDKIIEVHKNSLGINYFFTNWAKNQKSDVVELIKKFNNETDIISNGLTVSVQSMTTKVLDIIKRTNLKQHRIQEIFDLAKENNIRVYTELILGLPGETAESFMNSVFEIIEYGNHHGIDIFQCQLLENAELTRIQKEIYNIETKHWSDYVSPLQQTFNNENCELTETVAVTIETDTLPKNKMLEVLSWTSFMTMFHFYGFSTQLSRFLRKYTGESYNNFYRKLYQEYCSDRYFGTTHNAVTNNYRSLLEHGKLLDPMITLIPINAVNISSGPLMLTHIDNQTDYTIEFLGNFIKKHYHNLSGHLVDQLLDYQNQITLTYKKTSPSYQQIKKYDYNFFDYINSDGNVNEAVTVEFSTKKLQEDMEFKVFIENLYFRKKQHFGLLSVSKH
jgi:radical SAM superfamily enzyme YgiQ (UPF0313 family)